MIPTNTHTDSEPARSSLLIVLAIIAICVVTGGLFYVVAQQTGWTLGWIYLGLFATSMLIHLVCLLLFNPIVLARRIFPGAGTKGWDIVWAVTFIAILIAFYFVARHELNSLSGNPGPHGITWLIGASLFVFGWVVVTWAMIVNPFFEKTVRIQTDHGHHVVDSGPYAHLRHPGYVGFSALLLSTPLLLASAWTLVPALMAVVALVIRTVLEDRMLQVELPGYADYAKRVRFRLIPGVW